jgi:signal transduction histidine kinase
MVSDPSTRLLVLASSRRDAEATCKLFSRAGVEGFSCKDLSMLFHEIEKGAGALVIAKEALDALSIEKFAFQLDKQPPWSFLPIVLLAAAGDLTKGSSAVLSLLRPIRNVTLLERPVRISTFMSVVQAALADRRRQYKLRDVLAELEVSKLRAISASEAKSSFLANMSHEIRTPLGVIIGFAELILDPGVAIGEKASYMQTIRRNGQLLSALIDDVLDLAKVEAGRLTIERTATETRELILEVVAAMRPRALAKKVNLEMAIEESVPAVISTDSVRFKQILINIIGNAIKFTAEGKITIEAMASG